MPWYLRVLTCNVFALAPTLLFCSFLFGFLVKRWSNNHGIFARQAELNPVGVGISHGIRNGKDSVFGCEVQHNCFEPPILPDFSVGSISLLRA